MCACTNFLCLCFLWLLKSLNTSSSFLSQYIMSPCLTKIDFSTLLLISSSPLYYKIYFIFLFFFSFSFPSVLKHAQVSLFQKKTRDNNNTFFLQLYFIVTVFLTISTKVFEREAYLSLACPPTSSWLPSSQLYWTSIQIKWSLFSSMLILSLYWYFILVSFLFEKKLSFLGFHKTTRFKVFFITL